MKTWQIVLLTILGVFILFALLGWAMRKGAQVQAQTTPIIPTTATPPVWSVDQDMNGMGVIL